MNGKLAVVLLFLPPALFCSPFCRLPWARRPGAASLQLERLRRAGDLRGIEELRAALDNRAFRTALANNLLIILVRWQSSPAALLAAVLKADRIRGAVTLRCSSSRRSAEIAAGLIWRFVYDGDYGLLAGAADPRFAAPSCLRIAISRCTPSWWSSSEVLWLPHDALHRRAAADRPEFTKPPIDGATGRQMFWA